MEPGQWSWALQIRREEGKQAVLYEVVAEDTAEEYTSERRRQHGAYQRR